MNVNVNELKEGSDEWFEYHYDYTFEELCDQGYIVENGREIAVLDEPVKTEFGNWVCNGVAQDGWTCKIEFYQDEKLKHNYHMLYKHDGIYE